VVKNKWRARNEWWACMAESAKHSAGESKPSVQDSVGKASRSPAATPVMLSVQADKATRASCFYHRVSGMFAGLPARHLQNPESKPINRNTPEDTNAHLPRRNDGRPDHRAEEKAR
jgi:hypothetical protein